MSANLIILEYLTDTSVAPLQRDFVEIEDPFCSKVCLKHSLFVVLLMLDRQYYQF